MKHSTDRTLLISFGCPERTADQIVGGTTYAKCNATIAYPKYVYVAGGMRGYEKFNFPAFDKARDLFASKGFNVISPADIDRYCNPNAEDTTQDVSDQTLFVLRDFWANYFIRKIDAGENGIVLLNGWEKSVGAAGELFLVRWLGSRVYAADGSQYSAELAARDFAEARMWPDEERAAA